MTTNSQPMFYSHRSAGILILVGVLAGVTVGGGVGVIAASSTKTVTVCANKKTNMLRYAKNGKCVTKTETKVSLNQTVDVLGTPGAAGVKGDTGATGVKGDAGATGVNATVAITQQSVCDGSDADSIANEVCKVGMTGPGGGLIFFVDYNDQYTGLNYLEAAPQLCEGASKTWSSNTANSLVAVNGWAARAVGAGKANSAAMIANGATSYTADTSGAAFFAEASTCGSKDDWFLGSLGEMKLMYDNLQGVGGFASGGYWSSSEYDAGSAWYQSFYNGSQNGTTKTNTLYVRPVRAF
jgi:hypothetical protein